MDVFKESLEDFEHMLNMVKRNLKESGYSDEEIESEIVFKTADFAINIATEYFSLKLKNLIEQAEGDSQ